MSYAMTIYKTEQGLHSTYAEALSVVGGEPVRVQPVRVERCPNLDSESLECSPLVYSWLRGTLLYELWPRSNLMLTGHVIRLPAQTYDLIKG